MEASNYQAAIKTATQHMLSGTWNLETAKALFEAALARAVEADPNEAPFPLTGGEAMTWHKAQASALQWVLEMLPQSSRLNEAAPDLLEALTEWMRETGALNGSPDSDNPSEARARLAIAKAMGKFGDGNPSSNDPSQHYAHFAEDGVVNFVVPGYLAALSDSYHYLKGGERDFQARKLDALHTFLACVPLFTRSATYTSEMGAAANLYHASFPHAHPLPAQWQWSEVWKVMNAAESIVRATQTHVLYEKGDVDAPDVIKDRNGDITLGLCKVCGKGEAELSEPCEPRG